jgi:hypothetical protein
MHISSRPVDRDQEAGGYTGTEAFEGRQPHLAQRKRKILYGYTSKIFDLVTQAEYKLSIEGLYHGDHPARGEQRAGTYIFPNVIAHTRGSIPRQHQPEFRNTSESRTTINNGTLDFGVNGGSTTYQRISPLKSCIRIS